MKCHDEKNRDCADAIQGRVVVRRQPFTMKQKVPTLFASLVTGDRETPSTET